MHEEGHPAPAVTDESRKLQNFMEREKTTHRVKKKLRTKTQVTHRTLKLQIEITRKANQVDLCKQKKRGSVERGTERVSTCFLSASEKRTE